MQQLGIDPVELRVRNEPEVDPETGAVTAPSTQPWYEQISSSVAAADDPNSPR